ncbi:type II CAAX endopeptidase family protein [Candidatus Oleimmundimicrobium sp.]|uniref:CPBP family intramembrane glutamic endopeptidase n=1 Tax=Candidatus Oleimmundimicrobium sp. TaxID=3060597 RepID=UPI00271F11B3|nr:type II CAAX endopeptidase family protein [Candidatus Oleimmundimicrobium sp.]MDO8886588.1 type II CAAX endopeptidase family protein [Candidatus Oleimmundimicrobium sp.]
METKRVPWNIKDVNKVLIVFIVILTLQMYLGLFRPPAESHLNTPFGRVALMTVSYLILVLLVWFFGIKKRNGSLKDLGFKVFHFMSVLRKAFLWLVLVKILTAIYAVFTSSVLNFKPPPKMVTGIPDIFGKGISGFLLAIFISVVVAPLAEEIFFRGFIYTALRDKIGIAWAALISSFIFAIFHGSLWMTVPILLLGLVLAYFYERENSIGPPIIFHALNNLVSLLMIYYLGV